MKKLIALLLILTCITAHADSKGITVAQIATTATTAITQNPFGNYLDYKQEGVCYWYVCYGWYCTTETSPYVRHYMPDLLISVFNKYGDNPFTEGNNMIDKAQQAAGQKLAQSYFGSKSGSGNTGSTERGQMNKFYQVDVVGNPAINAVNSVITMQHINSVATPYFPYFSSLSDVVTWRTSLFEEIAYPWNLIPYIRIEGSRLMPWGSVFPRDGFITQPDSYKAAAVMAIRGADIVTSDPLPHVVVPIQTGSCGWPDCTISKTKENDDVKVKWQRIYPDPTTTYDKEDFGKNDMLDPIPYGQDYSQHGDNNYVFLAWRKYEGCVYHRGVFIKSVKWSSGDK